MQGWYNIHKSINVIHHRKKMKDKYHIVISVDTEKAFDKIHHPFMTKSLSKVRIKSIYLNIIKVIMTNLLSASYSKDKNYTCSP